VGRERRASRVNQQNIFGKDGKRIERVWLGRAAMMNRRWLMGDALDVRRIKLVVRQ